MGDERKIREKLYKEASSIVGCAVERLSGGDILRVAKEKHFFVVPFAGMPPLNTASASAVAQDKILTKVLLSDADIATPKGEYFFVSGKNDWIPTERTKEDAHVYAHSLGYPAFVKPHDQSRGRASGICTSEDELATRLKNIAEVSHVAMIEEVVEGREGRIFCIDGHVEFIYYKVPNNEGVGNVARGGEIINYQDTKIPTKFEQLAQKVFLTFGKDLRVFAIDFILRESEGTQEIVVLEVNAKPAMAGISSKGSKDKAVRIWAKMIELYFK